MKCSIFDGSVFLLVFAAWVGVAAQDATYRPFFRMERLRPGEDVCVLVAEDGNYRMERYYAPRTEIYIGVLDPAQIAQIHTMLTAGLLPTLSQAEIHNPLVSREIEIVQLNMMEKNGWRQLRFTAPESRKPYRASLDPLLNWFQDLQKELHSATKLESAPSRCAPPTANTTPIRPGSGEVAKVASGQGRRPPYLFRLYASHYYRGSADASCTIVFANGSFHRELSNQGSSPSFDTERRDKIVEGQLNDTTIQELREILIAPELRNTLTPPSSSRRVREGTMTNLTIPRNDGVQNLFFLSDFNSPNPFDAAGGGRQNLEYHASDEKVLQPLKHWIKQNVEKPTKGSVPSKPVDECSATGAEQPNEKSKN
jgi:hypothetical protein